MITKILYTLVVIAVVFGVTRLRARQRLAAPARPAPRKSPPRNAAARLPAIIAYTVTATIVALSASLYYRSWSSGREVVTVRVVNTGTGAAIDYRARRGDVGERSFETVDGWKVSISDVERLEVKDPGN